MTTARRPLQSHKPPHRCSEPWHPYNRIDRRGRPDAGIIVVVQAVPVKPATSSSLPSPSISAATIICGSTVLIVCQPLPWSKVWRMPVREGGDQRVRAAAVQVERHHLRGIDRFQRLIPSREVVLVQAIAGEAQTS